MTTTLVQAVVSSELSRGLSRAKINHDSVFVNDSLLLDVCNKKWHKEADLLFPETPE